MVPWKNILSLCGIWFLGSVEETYPDCETNRIMVRGLRPKMSLPKKGRGRRVMDTRFVRSQKLYRTSDKTDLRYSSMIMTSRIRDSRPLSIRPYRIKKKDKEQHIFRSRQNNKSWRIKKQRCYKVHANI